MIIARHKCTKQNENVIVWQHKNDKNQDQKLHTLYQLTQN